MTYDPHKDVKKYFPIFNDIENCVDELNGLLKQADEDGLSIRFTQANKKIPTPSGGNVDGPPKPKINMITLSWCKPKGADSDQRGRQSIS